MESFVLISFILYMAITASLTSLIYNTTPNQLSADAVANKNATITETESGITVTNNTTNVSTPGVFFGKLSRANGQILNGDIPLLHNMKTTLIVRGRSVGSANAFLYVGSGSNLIGRSHVLGSSLATITVEFTVTDADVDKVQIGVLLADAQQGDQFMITSVQCYQETAFINTSGISSAQSVTGCKRVMTSVNLQTEMPSSTSGAMILLNSDATINLPIHDESGSDLNDGTNYELFYNFSRTGSVVRMNSNASDVFFRGLLVYTGGYTSMPTTNESIRLTTNSTVGDHLQLTYYDRNWLVNGSLAVGTDISVVDADALAPLITFTSITSFINQPSITVTGTIASDGGAEVLSAGYCWSTTPTPTIFDSIHRQLAVPVGDVSFNISSVEPFDVVLYGRLFATNGIGTSYASDEQTFQTGLCLVEGTMILLADGTEKLVEQIGYNDELMVWDFDNATFASARPLWIKQPGTAISINHLEFSDGRKLDTVGHRIFNEEAESFTYPVFTPIGTHTFTADKTRPTLVTNETLMRTEPVRQYNIINHHHLNLFANGILTSCKYNNIYPICDMKFQKCERQTQLRDPRIPEIYHTGMRLAEQLVPIEDTMQYINRLEQRKLVQS